MEKQLPLFAYELTASAQQTIHEALTLLERQLREPGASFTSSSSVRDWLRLQLTMEEREAFVLLLLDNQHRLITHETLFKGTIGHAEPSQADRRVTERLKNALDLVGVRLLDHLVIGGMDIVSFAERGWL